MHKVSKLPGAFHVIYLEIEIVVPSKTLEKKNIDVCTNNNVSWACKSNSVAQKPLVSQTRAS